MSTITDNNNTVENVFQDDKKQSVIQLRKLVKENSKLKKYRVDDLYIMQFLYYTSFNITEAIQKMEIYTKTLIKYSSWIALEPPLAVKSIIRKNTICLLDARDKHGRAVFLIKMGNLDTSVSAEKYSSVLELFIDYAFMQLKTCENSISIIIDMENTPWKYLTWLTPNNIRIALKLITTYPCKDYIVHLVKTSILLDAVLKVLWPAIPTYIKELIKFHFKNWPSLHEYINPEDLPREYGGTGPDIDYDFYQQKIYDMNEKIKERLQYRKAIIKD